MFHSSPREALLKYFKHIKPSKEERIQSILPKPDGPSACLMPCLTIEAANSAVREIFYQWQYIGEDTCSPTPCDKQR